MPGMLKVIVHSPRPIVSLVDRPPKDFDVRLSVHEARRGLLRVSSRIP